MPVATWSDGNLVVRRAAAAPVLALFNVFRELWGQYPDPISA